MYFLKFPSWYYLVAVRTDDLTRSFIYFISFIYFSCFENCLILSHLNSKKGTNFFASEILFYSERLDTLYAYSGRWGHKWEKQDGNCWKSGAHSPPCVNRELLFNSICLLPLRNVDLGAKSSQFSKYVIYLAINAENLNSLQVIQKPKTSLWAGSSCQAISLQTTLKGYIILMK